MKAGLPTKIKGSIFSSHAIALLLLALLTLSASAQNAFQNLDFEQALISVPPPARLSTSIAMPGWKVWLNGAESSTVFYNVDPLTLWSVSIDDGAPSVYSPISGRYSVLFNGGRDQFGNIGYAAISQTGTIPADARTLLFTAKVNTTMDVSANGSLLPIVPLQVVPPFTKADYAVDISSLAGQTEDLRFSTFSEVFIDDIRFSTQAIPEPCTFALLAAAAAVFCGASIRRRK
jgi:hypothetical protein